MWSCWVIRLRMLEFIVGKDCQVIMTTLSAVTCCNATLQWLECAGYVLFSFFLWWGVGKFGVEARGEYRAFVCACDEGHSGLL